MSFIKTILLLSLLTLTYLQPIHAVEGSNIAYKISLSGQIQNKLSFLAETDIRPEITFKQAAWFLTTAELNYTHTHYLKSGIGYMLLNHYKTPEEMRNRYYIYLTAAHTLGPFTLSLRERFQSTFKRQTQHPNNFLRTMIMLSYKNKNKHLIPFLYAELFNNVGYKGKMHTDRIRLSAGNDIRINKNNTLQLYYRYHIFNAPDPVNHKHAMGITYAHRF